MFNELKQCHEPPMTGNGLSHLFMVMTGAWCKWHCVNHIIEIWWNMFSEFMWFHLNIDGFNRWRACVSELHWWCQPSKFGINPWKSSEMLWALLGLWASSMEFMKIKNTRDSFPHSPHLSTPPSIWFGRSDLYWSTFWSNSSWETSHSSHLPTSTRLPCLQDVITLWLTYGL